VSKPSTRELTEHVVLPSSTPARDRSVVTLPQGRPQSSLSGISQDNDGGLAQAIFSCVVDDHPRFHLDALRWFASLTAIAGVDPRDLLVHVVGADGSDALTYLRSRGVTMHAVDAFDPRSPHCNKVAGALRRVREGLGRPVVLCDTDIVVLEDPRTLDIPAGSIGGKVVDTPVPPIEVLHDIFAAAGIPAPPTTPLPWGENQVTVAGNNNGGLYLIPAPVLPVLAPAWETWARWLLDRRELLLDWSFHLDQVAMALALTAEGIGSEQLDVRWNTPTHDLRRIPRDAPAPVVIHYHQEIDREGCIRLTGFPSIDQQVERANESIGRLWLDASPTATFRQWRALTGPELGSSVSSNGASHSAVRDRLSVVLDAVAPSSVLEVGCGDGRATEGLPMKDYTGIDGSPDALGRARIGRPDGTFLQGRLADFSLRADLVIALEAVTSELDVTAYRNQVARVWDSAARALLISGYERSPHVLGPISHFYEPLSATLQAVASDAECYPVGEERGIATFVVLRPSPSPHPRDIGVATLSSIIDRHPDPLRLMALRLVGQETLGFFPDHAPRLWEYPVAAGLIMEHLPAGSRLVDVGAGVTPLAPYLTRRDYVVDTVDPSDIRRQWPPAQDWNEWGFVDYAEAGLGNRSWNCTLGELPASTEFDGALSISVIEHIPATDRRALLGDMARRLRIGGLMVLTVDLTRGGFDLWNRNRGLIVDARRHGSFEDVIDEGVSSGFELLRKDVVREWGDVDVDIGLIVMRRTHTVKPWRRAVRSLRRRVQPSDLEGSAAV
jgi:SAM-dependent methyltransferase